MPIADVFYIQTLIRHITYFDILVYIAFQKDPSVHCGDYLIPCVGENGLEPLLNPSKKDHYLGDTPSSS